MVQSGPSDDFSKERKMLEKLIKDLKQTREDLETTDKEWKKKVNSIDQQLVPILPLERVVNHEILLVRTRGVRPLDCNAAMPVYVATD